MYVCADSNGIDVYGVLGRTFMFYVVENPCFVYRYNPRRSGCAGYVCSGNDFEWPMEEGRIGIVNDQENRTIDGSQIVSAFARDGREYCYHGRTYQSEQL